MYLSSFKYELYKLKIVFNEGCQFNWKNNNISMLNYIYYLIIYCYYKLIVN